MRVSFKSFLFITFLIKSFQQVCINTSGDASKNEACWVEGAMEVMSLISCARTDIDSILSNWHALTEPKEDDAYLIFLA